MRTNAGIIGFTLAEFGLTTAFVLIALAPPSNVPASKSSDLRDRLAKLGRDLEQEQKRSHDLSAELERLNRTSSKLSDIPPACGQRPLVRVTVLSAAAFKVDGRNLTIGQLYSHHKKAISEARTVPCVNVVEATPTPGLSAHALIEGTKRLEKYFYVRTRTALP